MDENKPSSSGTPVSLVEDCIMLCEQTCSLERMISDRDYDSGEMSWEDWRDVEMFLLGAKVETFELYALLFLRVDPGEPQTDDAHILLNRRKSIGMDVIVRPGPFYQEYSTDEMRRPVLKRIEERKEVGSYFAWICRDIYLRSFDLYDGFAKSDLGAEAFKVDDWEIIERTIIQSGCQLVGFYMDLLEDFEPEERMDDDIIVVENETGRDAVRLRRDLGLSAEDLTVERLRKPGKRIGWLNDRNLKAE